MNCKGLVFGLLVVGLGTAEATDVRLEVRSSVQNERGGSALLDDRAATARSAMQVTPALKLRWEGAKTAVDVGLSPSMDVPGRGAGFVPTLRSDARLSYFAHPRVMFQTRLSAGRVSFDERSLWAGRMRTGAELRTRFAITPTLHATAGYRFAHSGYRDPELDGTALLDMDRSDDRQNGVAGLTWFSRHTWVYGEIGSERNESTLTSYQYSGRDLNFGVGGEIGRLSLALHGNRSVRDYDLTTGGTTTWRTLWTSVEATYALNDWVSLLAGVQREVGSQDGETAFDPWTFVHGGISVSMPLMQRRPTVMAAGKRLGPVRTSEGWVFRFEGDDVESVHLVGTFSGWDPDAYKLRHIAGTNVWEVVVPLDPGIYEYAYVVDGGRWVAPPRAQLYVDDGFGNRNGVLVVEDDTRR